MNASEFIDKLDDAKMLAAIQAAESKSSGELRVYISHRLREDALAAAQQRFLKLGMTKTRQRNAVLIYFAPLSHKFAIWGDVAVHEKCGNQFWQEIVVEMTPLLKQEKFTDAVVLAIQRVGEVLARHFPREPGDVNELSDEIARD